MDRRPVGVFDSGLGGLTCVREFGELGSTEDIIFFGDAARVPYGARSRETIINYALEDITFLLSHDVKMIIAACGTVSSNLPIEMLKNMPVPYVNVISPAAKAAVSATKNGKIGIIGTIATITSGAFTKEIHSLDGAVSCEAKACPLFVPLVENGYFASDCDAAKSVARDYLKPLKNAGVDTLLLGCTHYPLLTDVISEVMGDNVTLISAGLETARAALGLISEKGIENPSGGSWQLYSSDDPQNFEHLAEIFLGKKLSNPVRRAVVSGVKLAPCLEVN